MSQAIRVALSREAYRDRDETLFLLGYQKYADYLRSRLWQIIRARALDIQGGACRRCTGKATTIHHATYSRETMTGEDVRGLIPLCGRCAKATSLTRSDDGWARKDGRQVRALADTNALIRRKVSPKEPNAPQPARCKRCGYPRGKKSGAHKLCRRCLKGRKVKRFDSERIRAASAAYAFGDPLPRR